MKMSDLLEDGRIVKGVNTTPDVDTDEIKTQASKFGNKVDKDGRPPTLSKKVKGKSTNVLFNLGLAERFTPMQIALMEGGHSIEDTVEEEKTPGDLYTQLENFADGKKKGKSRPGRFKKAGVSCKGSVTSLRKKAKNSSGERQKGYHWCANMKSGRKKK